MGNKLYFQSGPGNESVRFVLSNWRAHWQYEFDAADQDDPAWPRIARLLRKRGADVDADFVLDYRHLQAVAGLYPATELVRVTAKGGAASGGRQPKTGEAKQGRRQQRRRQGSQQRTRIWAPWPQAKREHVAQARRLLTLMHEEVCEEAREIAPISWSYARLAVRQEMGQLDPARRWERLSVPRLLLALDFSGSMGGFVDQVAALGAALVEVLPWLVVAAAPNGELAPLTHSLPGKAILVDGQWRPLDARWWGLAGKPAETIPLTWRRLSQDLDIAGVIYVGDWEDGWIMPAFEGMRRGVLSVFQASYGCPARTDWHYSYDTPWPTVTRCGSVADFVQGLELLLAAWKT